MIIESEMDVNENMEMDNKPTEETPETDYSPYCKICGGCGIDGCCSAMNCDQSEEGDYCEMYLKDLKHGYLSNELFSKRIYDKLPDDLKAECDQIWSEAYDTVYKKGNEN